MRRIFIIIIDPDNLSSELLSRIDQLGETYRHLNNVVFLSPGEANLNAQEVFNRILSGNSVYPSLSIFVLSEENYAFWGYASRDLWTWIRNHREPAHQ